MSKVKLCYCKPLLLNCLLLSAVLSLALFSSCRKENEPPSLVGEWEGTIRRVLKAPSFGIDHDYVKGKKLEFNVDGTGRLRDLQNADSMIENFTYTYSADEFSLIVKMVDVQLDTFTIPGRTILLDIKLFTENSLEADFIFNSLNLGEISEEYWVFSR